MAHGGEFGEEDFCSAIFGGFGFREADGGDGGDGEDGGGDVFKADCAGVGAEEGVGEGVAFGGCDGGEVETVRDVADGVDVGDGGLQLVVDGDGAVAGGFF